MDKITFNKENLKIAMKIALNAGANIEVIPELMEELYPKGTHGLCNSKKANFLLFEAILEIDSDRSIHLIPSFSYCNSKEIPPHDFSKAMMEDKSLRKEFLKAFNQILKELKDV